MNRLDNKVAIVTGAAVGIGKSTALCLAAEGATVAVTDVEEAQDVVDEIENFGGTAAFWTLDTTDEPSVERVFGAVTERFGRLDILVNNAGIAGVDKPTDTITLEEWEHLMKVNVTGVFLCTKHAIPHMRRHGIGSIINLSSIYGMIGAGDLPPYHASKGAVRLMSKNDALIYAKEGIRVNSVHPGFIWTPLVAELGRRSAMGEGAFRRHLDTLHPLGHVGDPEDIAWGVVYLASDESRFVTGSELVIDGGYTAR